MDPNFISRIRFSFDRPSNSNEQFNFQESATDHMYENSICINSTLMPKHDEMINVICERTQTQRNNIKAFISPELQINATCVPYKDAGILFFNSSLINLLSIEEFCFIASHEIGHYLFQHNDSNELVNKGNSSIAKFQEVSCDRLGLYVLQNVESCIKCLVKIHTGLEDRHFILNVKSILEQEDFVSDNSYIEASTHPTLISRIKALLLYNTIYDNYKNDTENFSISKTKIDNQIKNDIDKNQRNLFEKIINKYKYWYSLKLILGDKQFSKNEQKTFENVFGVKDFNKAIYFLRNYPHRKALNIILHNIQKYNIEIDSEEQTDLIEKEVRNLFL